jgi:Abortive infection C-terminus
MSSTKNVPLSGLVGNYVTALKRKSLIKSDMADQILKTSISNFDAFNNVRNKHSMAHDNQLLGRDESILIVNHVSSSIRYIKAMEAQQEADDSKGTSP